jgi:hypothetical protein
VEREPVEGSDENFGIRSTILLDRQGFRRGAVAPSDGDALILDYNRYQPWYSPWRTMTDEIRVVRLSSPSPSSFLGVAPGDGEGSDGTVLLGWGCMKWSGGILNASPFCLYRTSSSPP